MNSIFIIFCSLFYSFMLICVYFSNKKDKKNKIFAYLMIINFIGLLLEISNYYTVLHINNYPILNMIISKSYLVYLISWMSLMTLYIYKLSDIKRIKNRTILKKIAVGMYLICAIIVTILPINFSTNQGKIYSYGTSVQFVYYVVEVLIILCLVFMFFKNKRIKTSKYSPLFIFIAGGACIMILQSIYPEIILTTSMETFVTFLIYFTIENNKSNFKAEKEAITNIENTKK